MSAQVTKHGARRVRKRLGLPKRTVQKLADRALLEGAGHGAFSGALKSYLDKVYIDGGANNLRVYHGYLFLFAAETLVTCWALPNKFLKQCVPKELNMEAT